MKRNFSERDIFRLRKSLSEKIFRKTVDKRAKSCKNLIVSFPSRAERASGGFWLTRFERAKVENFIFT